MCHMNRPIRGTPNRDNIPHRIWTYRAARLMKCLESARKWSRNEPTANVIRRPGALYYSAGDQCIEVNILAFVLSSVCKAYSTRCDFLQLEMLVHQSSARPTQILLRSLGLSSWYRAQFMHGGHTDRYRRS
jgi:hypothetical protein